MYIVTETKGTTTDVRGVFENRGIYDRNIEHILEKARMGSTVDVHTGKFNSYLSSCRFIERFHIQLVPETRKAVRVR